MNLKEALKNTGEQNPYKEVTKRKVSKIINLLRTAKKMMEPLDSLEIGETIPKKIDEIIERLNIISR